MNKLLIVLIAFMGMIMFTACGSNGDTAVSTDDALNNVLLIEGDDIPADGGMSNLVVEMTKTKNIEEDSFRFLLLTDGGQSKSYRAYVVSDETTTTVIASIFFNPNTSGSDKYYEIRVVYIAKDGIRTLGTVKVRQLG